jgi:hypothetical protein
LDVRIFAPGRFEMRLISGTAAMAIIRALSPNQTALGPMA